MKKVNKLITGIVIAALCVVMPASIAKAGTVSISADKDAAVVGDQLTVSVTVSDADGAAVAPDISVNYDANRLEFVSCSTEYGGGGGGYITLSSSGADIVFNILSGGQADVTVNGVFDGDGANVQTATSTVIVEGEDTAAAMSTSEESGTGVEAGSIATADGRVVSSVFADEFMPVGFYKTTATYEEQLVEAAQFDMGGIVLLYVTDADGNNGTFEMLDQATGELSDFLQITGIENRFIIALRAGEGVEVPDNFEKAMLQWNAQTLEAYAYTGTELPDNIKMDNFFLLYAVSSEGNTGWYMYDQAEGTYQRYVPALHGTSAKGASDGLLSQITNVSSDSSDEGGINVALIIVIALAVLLLALIITVIIMAVKLHEFNSYEYIDEDEEEENYLEKLAKSDIDPRTQIAADNKDSDVKMTGHRAERQERLDSEDISVVDLDDIGDSVSETEETKKPVRTEQSVRPAEQEESEKSVNSEKPEKPENIYEKYKREDEAKSKLEENDRHDLEDEEISEDEDALRRSSIPEEFVVRKKQARINREELLEQESYERDGGMEEDDDDYDDDIFSPRDRGKNYGKLSRADKKALKQEEKARKKAEKRMKKEYGEYGPVDWESWQNGVEGGERTAAAHMNRGAGSDEDRPVRRAPREEVMEQPVRRAPREEVIEQPVRRAPREEVVERPVSSTQWEEVVERPVRHSPQAPRTQQPKEHPMDMMRGIPANDNRAPVQAKPVQQFDFDDDFEFEFLNLDDDD